MSDDRRVEAAKVAILDRIGNSVDFLLKRPLSARLAKASIAAADAADRDARIHRVVVDDDTEEKVAFILYRDDLWDEPTDWPEPPFADDITLDEYKRPYRELAKSVIAILTGSES